MCEKLLPASIGLFVKISTWTPLAKRRAAEVGYIYLGWTACCVVWPQRSSQNHVIQSEKYCFSGGSLPNGPEQVSQSPGDMLNWVLKIRHLPRRCECEQDYTLIGSLEKEPLVFKLGWSPVLEQPAHTHLQLKFVFENPFWWLYLSCLNSTSSLPIL